MYGAELKSAREAAGLTTQQLAGTTRIHRAVIEQIEREETGRLPEPVFVRGYIQQLAKALGVPAEKAKSWIEDYIAQSGDLPPHRRQPDSEAPRKHKSSNVGIMAGTLLALLVLGLVFVSWPQIQKKKNPAVPQPEPVAASRPSGDIPEKTPPKEAPPEAAVGQPVAEEPPSEILPALPLPEPEEPAKTVPAPVPSPVGEAPTPPSKPESPPVAEKPAVEKPIAEKPIPEPVPSIGLPPVELQPLPADGPIPPAATPPAERDQNLKLGVKATEESWLTWQADNSPVQETLLLSGEIFNVEAKRKIWLKSGNAGGLQMTLNGHKLEPLGPRGKVRTVTYDHDTLRSLTETD